MSISGLCVHEHTHSHPHLVVPKPTDTHSTYTQCNSTQHNTDNACIENYKERPIKHRHVQTVYLQNKVHTRLSQ